MRSFRVSRLASDPEDLGEGTEPPEGFRAADQIVPGPAGRPEPQATALVALAPEVAWLATRGIPAGEIVRTRPDGWVEARVPWHPGEDLVAWVLSFGPDAEALEPAELRETVVRRLEAALAGS